MAVYEYGRIARLDESLRKANVDPRVIDAIMRDGETIRPGSTTARKADWMRAAMERMDQLLEEDVRRKVRQDCACCLGGKRLELSKAIARRGGSLSERVRAANETKFVFGHSVTLEEDGRILVRFAPDETADNRCVCLPAACEPISATYCYCCGGHVRRHLSIALSRELDVEVRSSSLSSGKKKPCSFWFTVREN